MSRAPYVQDTDLQIHHGDCVELLADFPDGSVDSVVTSPPYLTSRPEYPTLREFELPLLFLHLARVVTGGMLWNVGRCWRDGIEQLWWLEFIRAAQVSGWQHWDTAIWVKPNANPIHGHVLADSHEYVLVFGRDGVRFNEDGIRTEYAASSIPRMKRKWINGRGVKGDEQSNQDGRKVNELGARARSYIVATVGKEKGNKFGAPMAMEVAVDLVALASWPGQTILDPFAGSGTTLLAARTLERRAVGIEIEEKSCAQAAERCQQLSLLAEQGAA